MKYLKIEILALVVLVYASVLVISGCKKNHCYHCYYFNGSFLAIKGSDTVPVGGILAREWLYDSMNRYVSLGYGIDTIANNYFPDPSNGIVVCDTNTLYNGQPVRDSCSEII
jgi:hypothetical protein